MLGPVVVVFNTDDNRTLFMSYKSASTSSDRGIWPADRCTYPAGNPQRDVAWYDHSMLVVGYNMSHDPPYWILKNSFGPE